MRIEPSSRDFPLNCSGRWNMVGRCCSSLRRQSRTLPMEMESAQKSAATSHPDHDVLSIPSHRRDLPQSTLQESPARRNFPAPRSESSWDPSRAQPVNQPEPRRSNEIRPPVHVAERFAAVREWSWDDRTRPWMCRSLECIGTIAMPVPCPARASITGKRWQKKVTNTIQFLAILSSIPVQNGSVPACIGSRCIVRGDGCTGWNPAK